VTNSKYLSPLQEKFCVAYLSAANASEAYRKIYSTANMKPASVNRNAFVLLQNIKITSRIKELRDAAADLALIEPATLLREAMRLATSDIGGIMRNGKVLLPHELDAKTRAAVSSFKIDEYGRVEYKFWDKNAALEKLFKHKGLYEEDNKQKPSLVAEVRLIALEK